VPVPIQKDRRTEYSELKKEFQKQEWFLVWTACHSVSRVYKPTASQSLLSFVFSIFDPMHLVHKTIYNHHSNCALQGWHCTRSRRRKRSALAEQPLRNIWWTGMGIYTSRVTTILGPSWGYVYIYVYFLILRWRSSDIFKGLIEKMGESEAKRRRYI
jgi:hypothetical protein